MKSRLLLIALAVQLIVMAAALPASPWEFDEHLFFQGLHRFDPVAHHPPPPGYPVFILFAQLLRRVIPSDFAALVAISFAASAIGFVMLALALRNLTGDMTTGVLGAMLFYFSPGMLVYATLPLSDPGALALLAASLYFATRGNAAFFAACAALTVGWRPQFAIFIVPLLLVQLVLMRRWRDRAVALIVFTIVCLLWLAPLAHAVGGVQDLVQFEAGQGKYLAAHDAAQSRTGWTAPRVLLRFVAHPWGPKFLSGPVLLAALVGAVVLVRHRARAFLPLVIAGAVYLLFALKMMDPADGARYALPSVLVTACLAAVAIASIPFRLILAIAIACGSLSYVGPFLLQRRSSDAPPVRAAKFLRGTSGVVLYDLSLWPHATYYLADHHPMRIDDGLSAYFNRPDVPLFTYADGPGGRVFEWTPSDAYSKLTRNHYRVVSVAPIPPEHRFRILRGVSSVERAPGEPPWRWLAPVAEIELPSGDARVVTLSLTLPARGPLDSNEVTISINGRRVQVATIRRHQRVDVPVSVPAGAPIVRIESRRAIVPAQTPGSLSYDPRSLGIMLLDVCANRPSRS